MKQENKNQSTPHTTWPRWIRSTIITAIALLFIITGIWGASESGRRADQHFRYDIARKAIAVAATVPIDEARKLTFTADDAARPEFLRISSQFKTYSRATGLRCLYTMALRDGRIYFGPEGLDADSPLASPVGTLYEEPSELDFEVFRSAESIVQGPTIDEYGPYISASAPVIDPQTGKVMLVVGLDKDPADWHRTIRNARLIPLLILVLGLTVLGITLVLMNRRRTSSTPPSFAVLEMVSCAGLMLLLTAGLMLLIRQMDQSNREEAFNTLAQLKANAYAESFLDVRNRLLMLSDTFGASEEITHDEFDSYCQKAIRSYLITASAWLPEIPASQLPVFRQQLRNGGHSASLLAPPAGSPDEGRAFPVLFMDSEAGTGWLKGRDAYADPNNRLAIDECLRSGHPTASSAIRPADDTHPKGVVHIFQPTRSKHQQGVLSLTVDFSRLTERAVTGTSDLSVSLLEISPDGMSHVIFCGRSDCSGDCWDHVRARQHRVFPFFAFGNTYALMVAPEARWYSTHPLRNQQIALTAGLILTLLSTGLVGLMANRPMVLERQVRERTDALYRSEDRFDMAASAAGIGVWELNLDSGELIWDARMCRLYGIVPEDFRGTYEEWEQRVHPDDLNSAVSDYIDARNGISPYDSSFRIVRSDGGMRHIKSCAKTVCDAAGHPVRMIGVNLDVTDSKEHEDRITAQLEELNRWQTLIVGREHRVIDLKSEVNELLAQLGQSPRYKLALEEKE